MKKRVIEAIQESVSLKEKILENQQLLDNLVTLSDEIVRLLKHEGKVFFCGNGGSAADAQHLAAELSGKYYLDRAPLYGEALHVNTSYLTAVANDYSFADIYARLIQARGKKGDVLIGLSTSGNSVNVCRALEYAETLGVITVGFTGETGGKMKDICKYLFNVPSTDTPRIQEAHIMLGHILCELIETNYFAK